MDEKIIKIDVSTLAYNLNAILDFVFQNDLKEKSSEIRETYDTNKSNGSLELVKKTMAEVKTEKIDAATTLRYDLIKHLMSQADSVLLGDNTIGEDITDIDEIVGSENNPMATTLGEIFALNTLFNEGMLTNIDLNDLTTDNGKEE